MKKVRSFITGAIAVCFGGVFLFWLVAMIVSGQRLTWVTLVGVMVAALCFWGATRFAAWEKLCLPGWVLVGAFFLLYLTQCALILFMSRTHGWDVGVVADGAVYSVETHPHYFLRCPNNLFLTQLFGGWCRVLDMIGLSGLWYWCKLNLLNVLFMDAAVLLCGAVVKELTGKIQAAYAAVFLGCVFLAFRQEMVVPYSDTMVQPFVLGVIYCWLRLRKGLNGRASTFYSFGLGICAFVGAAIKPTVLIALIAAGLIELFFFFPWKGKWRSWKVLACCGLFCLGALPTLAVKPVSTVLEQKYGTEDALSIWHYMYIGFLEDGTFSQDAVEFSSGLKGLSGAEKAKIYLIEMRNYYKEQGGAAWLAAHEFIKLYDMGTDGTFGYNDGGAQELQYKKPDETLGGFLQNYVYPHSPAYQKWVAPFQQGLWLALCALMIVAAAVQLKKRSISIAGLMLSVMGLVLFLLLFENNSRYLLPYFPVLVCIAAQVCVTF